jgi:ABC-type sugar transport system ATPase subunit
MTAAHTAPTPPPVELVGISKSFGPTRALRNVSFDLRAAEVHVIAGENGAGKSTLIRVLSGVYSDYSGNILIDGRLCSLHHPSQAARAGIATIHQELSLIGPMSIADNLLLGDGGSALGVLSRKERILGARRILDTLELELDPERSVETLPLSQRQLLEIARALARRARVLIMDEPTSSLSEQEAAVLFAHIEKLVRKKTAVVYISHRMEEIYRVADRITLLSDGTHVLTAKARDLAPEALVEKMVGRTLALGAERPRRPNKHGKPCLSVKNLSVRDPRRPGARLVDGVSLTLQKGEILGLAGQRGSGNAELLQALFSGWQSGLVELEGRPIEVSNEHQAIRRGFCYLASDRMKSVITTLNVVQNATLSSLARFARWGFVRSELEVETVSGFLERLRVSAPSLRAPVARLSGGNQQKVALLRCLLTEPSVLLLDEPTRGIDVGAKADIYDLILGLSEQGVAILLVASELSELLSLSDRISVMYRGRIAGTFERGAFDRQRITALAMGGQLS